MNTKELAELLYPDVSLTIEDLEKRYPKRDLPDNAEVTRFAPSPTGRLHMGGLYATFIPEVMAYQSNGVFILRIEDTDEKRAIENGTELILEDLKAYGYHIDEDPIQGGNYGPYIQSQRLDIYHAVAKYLVSIGRAYPCFCSSEDLDEMRQLQTIKKDRIGYYGKYAACRNLTLDEIKEHLANGDKWVLRLKSEGNFDKTFIFNDLIKGKIELPENDIDQVIVKSDGVPPYAFAHVCDDHFMRVTTVTRDDSYISSVPFHLELWNACGFEPPKFAHLLPINVKDGDSVRKISKRKDPEAAVSFYTERGLPNEAVKLYFATLMNTNFDGWLNANPTKSYRDFEFSFSKMNTSGSLFDLEKLINLSKNYISRLTAEEVFENLNTWSKEYDKEFNEIINKDKDYTTSILNIEREQAKPRKDFSCYKDIKEYTWYMFDELFNDSNYEWQNITDKDEIKKILNTYFNDYYDINDDKDTWFNKIKELCDKLGYASNMKDYKEDPSKYKGNVADFTTVIRVAITTKNQTPDLYEVLRILGIDRIKERISRMK